MSTWWPAMKLLARRGISLFETNRGGDVTYHGPGQLVGYPILNLRGFTPPLGIVEYLRRLEEVLIRACADYGVLTQRAPGRAGVWTMPGGAVAEKKIAALGVHVARGVTTHGFALNVTTDLDDFASDRALWHPRSRRHQHGSGGRSSAFAGAGGQRGIPALWPGLWPADGLGGNARGSAARRSHAATQ